MAETCLDEIIREQEKGISFFIHRFTLSMMCNFLAFKLMGDMVIKEKKKKKKMDGIYEYLTSNLFK